MARNPRNVSAATPRKRAKRTRVKIPEPFQLVTSAIVARKSAKIEVPMLVLYGEWLKACGFPIGAGAYLTTDRRGELALNRIGLGFPRRLRIRATPR
jgi:hypothetical protein